MTLKERREAIGGPETAKKYLRIMVKHLAQVMADDKFRAILHSVIPDLKEGEIHISKIAEQYPQILETLSKGFKDAVADGAISGHLAQLLGGPSSDAEMLHKASKALCDLILTVVALDDQTWNPTRAIPVFFSPLTDEKNATVMEGVDTDLRAITAPFGRGKEGRPSVYLLVKADENSPMIDSNKNAIKVSMTPSDNGMWSSIFKSFNSIGLVSSAYAHDHHLDHGPHYSLIKPAKEITIFEPHEDETRLDIKIDVRIKVTQSGLIYNQSFDLTDVDYVDIPYTDYAHLVTEHGLSQYWNGNRIYWIRIYETDWWNDDDEVCRWSNVELRSPGQLYLPRDQGDIGIGEDGQGLHQDAELTIERLAAAD